LTGTYFATVRNPEEGGRGGRLDYLPTNDGELLMNNPKQAIDHLNALLRGELAATMTYQQALEKVGNEPGVTDLRRVHGDHREAANTLRQHIHHHGGKPEQSAGVWGTFAKAWEGTAALFGNSAALAALKQGEERGISDYEAALKDANLAEDCKELIRANLLPQTREHVQVLERVIAHK